MKSETQEIFDIVAVHLLTQNAVSESPRLDCDGEFQCAYRSPEGLKCAIGILIPDELYSPIIEGTDVGSIIYMGLVVTPLLSPNNKEILAELQMLHDGEDPLYWLNGLEWVAKNNGLDASVLDKFR